MTHLDPEELRAWIDKHLATAPERDDQWYREVQAIYRLGRKEAAAKAAAEKQESPGDD